MIKIHKSCFDALIKISTSTTARARYALLGANRIGTIIQVVPLKSSGGCQNYPRVQSQDELSSAYEKIYTAGAWVTGVAHITPDFWEHYSYALSRNRNPRLLELEMLYVARFAKITNGIILSVACKKAFIIRSGRIQPAEPIKIIIPRKS